MAASTLHILPLGRKEEKILIKQLEKGAPQAFKMLYHHFVGRVMGLSRQLLRDQTAAEDATQETFLRIYRSIHRFRGDSRLATWIHRIATNVCLTEIERRQRRNSHETGADAEDFPEPEDGAQSPSREITMTLTRILGELEPRKRVTFYLCHVEGFSAAEIAEVMGEKRAAVLKRLQRTRKELMALWYAHHRAITDSWTKGMQ